MLFLLGEIVYRTNFLSILPGLLIGSEDHVYQPHMEKALVVTFRERRKCGSVHVCGIPMIRRVFGTALDSLLITKQLSALALCILVLALCP